MNQAAALSHENRAKDADLREAMEAFLMDFGFTALRVTIGRLESELSKEHRQLLALQGWIA